MNINLDRNLNTYSQRILPESLLKATNYITSLVVEKIKNSANISSATSRKLIINTYSFIPVTLRCIMELTAWRFDSSAAGDKAKAIEEIKEAFFKKHDHLVLSNTELNSIPSCIDYLAPLKRLRIECNPNLTSLPSRISNLTQLEELYLSYNELNSFPSEIGTLTQLTHLALRGNKMTFIPTLLGNFVQLKYLNLGNNVLASLPSEIGNLTQLEELYLCNNKFNSFPSEIGNLTQLEELSLSYNELTSFPSEIGNLSALNKLFFNNNLRLTGLPLEITSLNNRCTVDLSGCALSAEVMERLRTVTQNPDYRGPQIHFSRVDANPSTEERSIDESLDNLFKTAEQSLQIFENLPGAEVIESKYKSWLSRLSYMNEFKNGSQERQKTLATKILHILKLANENQEYRQVFNLILDQAATTCGDRVALSVMHLGLQQKLQTIDKTNLPELATLLKGIWATALLENIATTKVSTMPFVDEIEVYLGYPVMLKEILGLPIDVEEMLFFTCSHLKDKDLNDAEALVKSNLNDEAAVHQFLISQEVWVGALKNAFFAEYQELDDKRYEDLENGVDAAACQSKFNAGLIKLTKKALNLSHS